MSDKHSLRSSEREEYVEYIFLAELCSYAWMTDRFVEVARAQTDAFGYDVVLSCGSTTRHVQLKASKDSGSTRSQKINTALAEKPSGCVVWLLVDEHTLKPTQFRWFGGSPNEPLPYLGDKSAKHTKGNSEGIKAERASIREVSKSKFAQLDKIEDIFALLFGPSHNVNVAA